MRTIRISIVLFMLVCSLQGSGQSVLDKGNYYLAGGTDFSSTKSANSSFHDQSTSLSIAPEFSYFIIDNLLIGGTLSYYHYTYEWTEPIKTKSVGSHLGIGPSVKYYFRTEKLIPFVASSFVFNKGLKTEGNGYNWNISTGFDIFIAQSLALEPFVNYQVQSESNEKYKDSRLSLGIRLNYFLVK